MIFYTTSGFKRINKYQCFYVGLCAVIEYTWLIAVAVVSKVRIDIAVNQGIVMALSARVVVIV